MKLCIASHNDGKIKEFEALLKPLGYEVVSAQMCNVSLDDIVEDGESFADNARIKSKAIFEQTNILTLSDDSGLMIDALPTILGVRSARFLGEETPYSVKLPEVLKRLNDVENRDARFVSALSLYGENVDEIFLGTCEGVISQTIRGASGFGYDPIFIPESSSLTFGEMSDEQKHAVSHRARAVAKLVSFLKV